MLRFTGVKNETGQSSRISIILVLQLFVQQTLKEFSQEQMDWKETNTEINSAVICSLHVWGLF